MNLYCIKCLMIAKNKDIKKTRNRRKSFNGLKYRHYKFFSINSALKEYDDKKETIKNLKTSTVHQRFYSAYEAMLSYCLNCRKKQKVKPKGLQIQIMEK